jgi:hypothetical protein
MTNQLDELVNTPSKDDGDIGVVFKYYKSIDIKSIMNPLVAEKDYHLVCFAKGISGCFIFIRVNNTDRNKILIEKINNIDRFLIPKSKVFKISKITLYCCN